MNSPVPFTLRVPESWFEFDIWRATRTGDLARMVDKRTTEHPALAPHRSALLKALREAAETAERHGAVYCAAMLDHVEDAGMLAATLMVLHTDGPPDPGDHTVEAIAGQVTAVVPEAGTATWRRVEIIEIAAGRAVRIQGVDGDVVVMQTLIPVPGRGVLDVVLASPQVELAESMLDLFDAVSGTLAWPADTDNRR